MLKIQIKHENLPQPRNQVLACLVVDTGQIHQWGNLVFPHPKHLLANVGQEEYRLTILTKLPDA